MGVLWLVPINDCPAAPRSFQIVEFRKLRNMTKLVVVTNGSRIKVSDIVHLADTAQSAGTAPIQGSTMHYAAAG